MYSEKEKAIKACINNDWKNDEIIDVWNRICEDNNNPDDIIYCNGEDFFTSMFGCDIMSAVRAVSFGSYNFNDCYVRLNGYGNVESFDYWDDDNSPMDIDEIVEYVIDNGDCDTPEIDTDYLQVCFINAYYKGKEEEYVKWCDKIDEEEDFDLLTEDWDDLHERLEAFIEESKED